MSGFAMGALPKGWGPVLVPISGGWAELVSLQPQGGLSPSDRGVVFSPAIIHVPLVWLMWKREGLGVPGVCAQGCVRAGEAEELLQSHPGEAVLCLGGLCCAWGGCSVTGGLCCARQGCWWVVGLQGCAASGLELAQLDGAELGVHLLPRSAVCRVPASSWTLPRALVVPPPAPNSLQIWEYSSCGRREAETVALGFPEASDCLFPPQLEAVQAASHVVFCACP